MDANSRFTPTIESISCKSEAYNMHISTYQMRPIVRSDALLQTATMTLRGSLRVKVKRQVRLYAWVEIDHVHLIRHGLSHVKSGMNAVKL